MSSSRVAALRRARQRQARIEAATARAMRAQAALNRAIQARSLAAERHDIRVRDAEQRSAAEAAELARVCGSADAAAEILGWNVRDVRKVLRAEHEQPPDGRAKPLGRRRPQVASQSGVGDTNADL
jgi:hypothetical protein